MRDISCLLAGLLNLCGPPFLVIFWHKRTGARFYPALIAFAVCLPVFFIGNALRSGFDRSSPIAFYIQQGLIFGILEETAKYLVLRYGLKDYDNRRDAVTYAIGHSSYENLGIGLTCLGLIGTGTAIPEIFFFQLWSFVVDTASAAAVGILIFYGIYRERAIVIMPTVILLHAIGNASVGIFIEPVAILISMLIAAGECFAAYRCWQVLRSPFEDEQTITSEN